MLFKTAENDDVEISSFEIKAEANEEAVEQPEKEINAETDAQ